MDEISGYDNIAFGRGARAYGYGCVAIGIGAEAHGEGSMAIGHGVIARDGERKVVIPPKFCGQGPADDWYEFFQSLRASLAGLLSPKETDNG